MTSRGATDNSPALQRWVIRILISTSPARDERTLLLSLSGLGSLVPLKPSVERLGYFNRETGVNTVL